MDAERDRLIERIIALEWKQFDEVNNEGGRASCQDDWGTFSIMRRSQFLVWPSLLLRSYLHDLERADEEHWNLLTEKYARMMESTAPDQFARLKDRLPVRSKERLLLQETVIGIQLHWTEEFAQTYPRIWGTARQIYSELDTPQNTSYETYLRGEMGTYSDETFLQYALFILNMKRQKKNVTQMIIANTAGFYGFASLEEMEAGV